MVKVNSSMLLLADTARANNHTQAVENMALLQTDNNHMSAVQIGTVIGKVIGNVKTSGDAVAAATGLLSMAKTKGRWSQEEKDALVPLMANLGVHFDGQLQTEHQLDQAHWSTETAKQVGCHSVASAKFLAGGEVSVEKETLSTRKVKLKSCHAVEKAWDDYKLARQCALPKPVISFGEVSVHDSALETAMATLASKVSTYHSILPVDSGLPAGDCRADQVSFEDQMCLVRRLHRWSCEAQDECSASVDLANTRVTLTSNQDNRRSSKLSFKKSMCEVERVLGLVSAILGLINPTADAGEAAETTPPVTCDSLLLDAGDLMLNLETPAAEHCKVDQDPEVSVYPSQTNHDICSAWTTQEYQNWGSDYTDPTGCKATCADAPTTAAPTAAPQL